MAELVSVIIACYNAAAYIDQCLESIVKQTYSNIEIIVCDDASTDDSLSILRKWESLDNRIKVIKNDTNLYAAATRNRCFEIAQGKYFLIQDVDDISYENRIESLISELEENSEISFISSSMEAFDDDPNQPFRIMSQKNKFPSKWAFLWNSPFYHPSTMFKRECILDVQGYRVAEETRRGQDYDLYMRLYARGYKGENYDKVLYKFRLDKNNINRRTFKARIGEYKIRKKGFKNLHLYPIGYIFLMKPFVAHIVQKIKYIGR